MDTSKDSQNLQQDPNEANKTSDGSLEKKGWSPEPVKKKTKAKVPTAKKAEGDGINNGKGDEPETLPITNDAHRKPWESVSLESGRMEEEEWHEEHEFENEVHQPYKVSVRSKSPDKVRIDKRGEKRPAAHRRTKLTKPKHHRRKFKSDDMRPRKVESEGKLRSQKRRHQHKHQHGHVHRVRSKLKRDNNTSKRRQTGIANSGKRLKTSNERRKSVYSDALRPQRMRKKTPCTRRCKDGNGKRSGRKCQNASRASSRRLSKTSARGGVKDGKRQRNTGLKKKQPKPKGRIKRRKKTMLSRRRSKAASSTTKTQTSNDEKVQRHKGRNSLKRRRRKGILKPKQSLNDKHPAKSRHKSTSRPGRLQKKGKSGIQSKGRKNNYKHKGRKTHSVQKRNGKKPALSSSSTSDLSRPEMSRKPKNSPMNQWGLEDHILTAEPLMPKPTTTTAPVVQKTTTPPRVPESIPNESPFQIPMTVNPVAKEAVAKKPINAKEPLETFKPIVKEPSMEKLIVKWPPVQNPIAMKEVPEKIPIMKESLSVNKPIMKTSEAYQGTPVPKKGAEVGVVGIVRSDKEGNDHIDRRKDSEDHSL